MTLWGTVAFSVESGNIVGYNNMPMAVAAKQQACVPFQNVGGTAMSVQDIVPKEDGDAVGEGESTLWYWDTDQNRYVYAYWTQDLYEDDGSEEGVQLGKAGWCNNLEDLFVVNYTFSAGQGFWILPSDLHSAPSVLISGQVVQSESDRVGVPMATASKQQMGNPFPTSVAIQDIVPLENGAAIGEGESTLWYWDTTQNKYAYAYWTLDLYEDDGSEEGVQLGKAGWCNNLEDLFIVSHTFTAGQGFWILPSDLHAVPTVTYDNPLK